MKLLINNCNKLSILIVVLFLTFSLQVNAQVKTDIYELSIQDLHLINVIPDTTDLSYAPTYEISIQDLMNLNVVKELKVENYFDVTYDIPLKDLLQIKLELKKGIQPTYEMSLTGLIALEVKENVEIIDKIDLSYDISLEGVMHISVK